MVDPAPAPEPVTERWCIGFTDVDASGHWLRRLIRWLPHPRHVVVFMDTPVGLLSIQQTVSGLLPLIQPGATEASFTAEIERDGGFVRYATVTAEDRQRINLRPFSCVDVARAIVCLPYRPQTPKGLMNALERRR